MTTPSRSPSLLACLLLGALAISPAVAGDHDGPHPINASPHPFTARQPDGRPLELFIRGSEHVRWYEDTAGYPVARGDDGRWVYARQDAAGQLRPTPLAVGAVDPQRAGIDRRVAPQRGPLAPVISTPSTILGVTSGAAKDKATAHGKKPGFSFQKLVNVVILMRFTNHATRTLPSVSDFDVIMNKIGGDPDLAPTGSVRDFYYENSYGTFILDSTVYAWVDLPQSEAYYADGFYGLTSRVQEAIEDALDLADPLIDFSQFDRNADGWVDAITFIHSGFGAEWGGTDMDGAEDVDRIWSHKWSIPTWTSAEGVSVSDYHVNPGLWGLSGTEAGHIGVICHETGHFLGLPDLYDTDGGGSGLGSYGCMANSWGFDGSQLYPPHFSPWSKIRLGWLTPTVVDGPGVYTLRQAETSPDVLRIDDGYPSGEYLLVENRQPLGFDGDMPQGGLAVWHIDEAQGFFWNTLEGYPGQAGWPGNNNHYRVALLQADGNYDLELGNNRGDGGDVFHAGGVNTINEDTVPDTDAYQSGVVLQTDNELASISASSFDMSFTFSTQTAESTAGTGPLAALRREQRAGSLLSSVGDVDDDGVPDVVVAPAGDDDALWVLLMNDDGTVRAKRRADR